MVYEFKNKNKILDKSINPHRGDQTEGTVLADFPFVQYIAQQLFVPRLDFQQTENYNMKNLVVKTTYVMKN